jgi:tRNA (guanine-N7-)-methyltransferase
MGEEHAEARTDRPAAHGRIRSFVVRAGRAGPGQLRARETLGPRFVLPYAPGPLDRAAAFGRVAPLVVEIGFGMGAATAAIAAANPGTDYLGIEVHPPGVGALLKRIGEASLANVRIVEHDAVEVLERMVAPGSLAGVHVFFPDPWHKKRHHKRRLLQPPFVALLASRLAPGGVLHAATDWEPYAEEILATFSAEPALRNAAEGYAPKPASRPETKFEARGLRLGHAVRDLVFVRRPSAPSPAPP